MFQSLNELISLDEKVKNEQGILYTPAEIARQPEVWQETKEIMRSYVRPLRELLEKEDNIILTGAGSSYFAGKCVEAVLAASRKGSVQCIPSTEIVMDPESTLPRSPFTLISFARSGNSPEGNAAFQLAEQLRAGKAKHVVFTCNREGELAALARQRSGSIVLCTLPPKANDKGLAMTSSFTSMVIAALSLVYLDNFADYERTVDSLIRAAVNLLKNHGETLKRIAGQPFERVFFVGARPFYGSALESHLKVQEMTDGQVVGKAEDTLGLRHGPMAAIDDRTLVVLFASMGEYRRRFETDLLTELANKNLGQLRVVVCKQAEPEWKELCDHVLEFSGQEPLDLDDKVIAPVLVLPAQVVGLFKSLSLGLSPDTPSRANVINRVVKGVTIYPYAG